jgi:hypothetical protein
MYVQWKANTTLPHGMEITPRGLVPIFQSQERFPLNPWDEKKVRRPLSTLFALHESYQAGKTRPVAEPINLIPTIELNPKVVSYQ